MEAMTTTMMILLDTTNRLSLKGWQLGPVQALLPCGRCKVAAGAVVRPGPALSWTPRAVV